MKTYFKNNTLKFALVFFFLFASTCLADKVALMPIQTSNIDSSITQAYSDRLQNLLSRTSNDTLIERQQLNLIIKEQGLTQIFCKDDECKELGKLLNADKLISCRISQLGKLISASAQYVDVQTGLIERSVILDFEGSQEAFLTEGIETLSQQLSAKLPPKVSIKETVNWEPSIAWASTGLALGSGFLGWYFNSQTEEAFKKFEQKIKNGSNPKTSEIEKYQNFRNASYISGAVFALNATLFFWSPWKNNQLNAFYTPSQMGMQWSMSF